MWRCDIPDSNGVLQSIYIYLGTPDTGIYLVVFLVLICSNCPQVSCHQQSSTSLWSLRLMRILLTSLSHVRVEEDQVEWRRDGVRVEEDSNHMTSQIIVETSRNTVYNNTLRVRGREGGLYLCSVSNNRHEYVQGASITGPSATQRVQSEFTWQTMSFTQFHISPSETYKSQCYLQDTYQYFTGVGIQHNTQP